MTKKEVIETGAWSLESLEDLLRHASTIDDAGKRISYISEQFLGTGYEESTLNGSIDTEEVFTLNLGALDCFTLIDYVEAMRLSSSFYSFRGNLKKVRYQNGIISFEKRNHFFTDWILSNADQVEDVTQKVGAGKTRPIRKRLNIKEDGMPFVPGIRSVQRDISYIPSSAINDEVTGRLNNGDYVGIYSGMKGLDVSHVGIFIREGSSAVYRHASSRQEHRKVLDEDFVAYVSSKPGIIILRPRASNTAAG